MNALNMRVGIASRGSFLLASAAMTLGAGCGVPVYSEPVAVSPAPVGGDAIVYVDAVPPNIDIYPHYYYSGAYVYYVDGRWYRQGHQGQGGWGYYRQEPPELARQQHYAPQAYAAPRERDYVQVAPAAPRETPHVVTPRPGVVEAQPRSREVRRADPPNEHEDRSR